MSDEFDNNPENNYSSFWPLLILVGGLLIWFAIQDYLLNNQRSAYNKQFQDPQFVSMVSQADNVSTRYVALMKDLVETSAKDPTAAQIVKDAIASGLIHVQPNANGTNSATTPAAPSK
jgi:hypothetical protein